MAAAAGHPPVLLQGVFDGCIAAFDAEVRRRPYHRNCSCAFHEAQSPSKGGHPKCGCSGEVSFRFCDRSKGASSAGSLVIARQGRKICCVESKYASTKQ